MACIFDKYLVIDIEATCWKTPPPPGMESEIIEIGACLIDAKTFEIEGPESIIVKPERSRVSEFCTQLTTLTQEDVDKGISFRESCDSLRYDWQSRKRCWISWGNYDRKLFERLCMTRRIPYPFGPTHINFKNLFSIVHRLDQELGMADALSYLKMDLKGTHHRGCDDAYNIARLWVKTFEGRI